MIPPLALLALLVVAMYPFRDDLGSGTIALILLLPPLVATVGGLWVALAMAAVCAGALNFFFIHPYYSFRIESGESVAAFFMYLLVAAIVAVFSSRLRASERTTSRRAAESEFLHRATIDLLTADRVIPAVRDVLAGLQGTVGLTAVRLRAASPATGPIDERAGQEAEDDRLISFPISNGDAALGALEVTPGRAQLADDERRLLEQFADVVAIALEQSTSLHVVVGGADRARAGLNPEDLSSSPRTPLRSGSPRPSAWQVLQAHLHKPARQEPIRPPAALLSESLGRPQARCVELALRACGSLSRNDTSCSSSSLFLLAR